MICRIRTILVASLGGLYVSGTNVPAIAQPRFFFDALPELPGGASESDGSFYNPPGWSGWPWNWGRSRDSDGVWKAVVWSKAVAEPWQVDILPNPLGNTESAVLVLAAFAGENLCPRHAGGYVSDAIGAHQPILWTTDCQSTWTTEPLPLPPGATGGEIQFLISSTTLLRAVALGFSIGSDGISKATIWTRELAAPEWVVEELPNYGEGFLSDATSAVFDPGDPTDPTDDRLIVGGSVQTDSSAGPVPCVWQELPGGGFQRIELPMAPGAYLGSVNGGEVHFDGEIFAVGYNAFPGGIDFYRGTLQSRSAGTWNPPVTLDPLPGSRDARANVAIQSGPNSAGAWCFGHSYSEVVAGEETATLWDVAADQTVTAYDLNDRTVNRPPDTHLAFCGILPYLDVTKPSGETISLMCGTHTLTDSPLTPHGHVLVRLSKNDCNKNGEDDALDLYFSTSADANGNGVPDECDAPPMPMVGNDVCIGGANAGNPCAAHTDCPGGLCRLKNRFITAAIPATAAAHGLKVTLVSIDANSVATPSNYNGTDRWAGVPLLGVNDGASPPFNASKLQCTFHSQDWSAVGQLHLYGDVVVPSSSYDASICASATGPCSATLRLNTARFGDVIPPVNAVNFQDVNSIVAKFQGTPAGPSKTRTKLTNSIVNPTNPINFQEVSACVSAFQGKPFRTLVTTLPATCP